MGIKESALSVIASLTDSDFIRAVTAAGESRKIQATGIGKYAVETYSGSTLAGSAQSVQSAVGGLKNDITTMQGDIATLNTNLINKLKKSLIVGTASGSIASFNNGSDIFPALKCVAKIDPAQDLHGYDKPWVGGAGKNLIALSSPPATAQTTEHITIVSQNANELKISTTSEYTYSHLRLYYTLPAGTYTLSFNGSSTDSYTPTAAVYNGSTAIAVLITQTAPKSFTLDSETSINIRFFANLNTTGDSRTVTFSKIQLEKGSSQTSFAPYENICPISGHTEVDVVRAGKNLFDSGVMSDAATGAQYVTINLKPNTEYTMSSDDPCKNGGAITDLFFCNMDETVNSTTNGVKLGKTVTRTSDENGQLRVGYRVYEGWITPTQLIAYKTQIEVGSVATDFSTYIAPTTYTVSWSGDAGTVYGGTVDVVSGELTVEYIKQTITSFSGAWGSVTNGYAVYVSANDTVHAVAADSAFMKSSMFSFYEGSRGTAPLGSYGGNNGADTVQTFILPPTITSLNDANTWLSNQADDLDVTFKLATPTTYTLTAQQVDILLGDNNIFANTGPMDPVEYYADATITIQNLS